ncbi:aquaporin family protein [Oenococcus sp. UCMA 16435]|nr:aquaporin family protein [Oenococcus sp. UCMA 16435]
MYSVLVTKLAAEFFGTAILIILGNGAVANMALNGTTGRNDGGWLFVALGYGFGVMIPAMMFGSISGNHLNPAVTIAFASIGRISWSLVIPYITVQLLGAMTGQLVVVSTYWPFYKKTSDESSVFMTFSTGDGAGSWFNGFVNEFFGTLILVFGALGLYKDMFFKTNTDIANIGIGLLIMVLVISIGGATGPAINPARDLGPRIILALFKVPNKGKSVHWDYAWVPILAPIFGGLVGANIFHLFFD